MRSGGWKTCTLAIRYLDPMDAENVVLIPACGECDAVWLPADEDRWAAYLTDDEPPEVVFCLPTSQPRRWVA